ncbi:MAG: sigma-54-dependent Fis family transcriptional regulator [Gemmatimonadetes bacterium]|nr:sigma-54-dependent Fis family transcriptional regulator [Gemmatimonadota bacterium]
MPLSVIVVDDDATVREALVDFFELQGAVARAAATASEGRRLAAQHACDVAIVDLRLPDAPGLTLLEALRADDPELAVIVLTGHADVPTAVRAMRQGAVDLLEKPVDLAVLLATVERAAEGARMRRELAILRTTHDREPPVPGDEMLGVERLLQLAARNDDVPVLLTGETGTGKGYAARRIHDRGPRAARPFVAINAASLAGALVESELFGHEKGAFTDARSAKRGLLEVAGTGTVFLDEVAELPLDVQPRLLRVLEDGTFRRVGGVAELRSAARLIVATNQLLDAAVASGRFRADLRYRLQVLVIELPPLRERRGEIPALAAALAPRDATLTDDAIRALVAYSWPGNIRELKHVLWRAAIVAEGRPIKAAHLGLGSAAKAAAPADTGPMTLEEAERRAIEAALIATGGNKVQAAKVLGIARSTLQERVHKLGISVERARAAKPRTAMDR